MDEYILRKDKIIKRSFTDTEIEITPEAMAEIFVSEGYLTKHQEGLSRFYAKPVSEEKFEVMPWSQSNPACGDHPVIRLNVRGFGGYLVFIDFLRFHTLDVYRYKSNGEEGDSFEYYLGGELSNYTRHYSTWLRSLESQELYPDYHTMEEFVDMSDMTDEEIAEKIVHYPSFFPESTLDEDVGGRSGNHFWRFPTGCQGFLFIPCPDPSEVTPEGQKAGILYPDTYLGREEGLQACASHLRRKEILFGFLAKNPSNGMVEYFIPPIPNIFANGKVCSGDRQDYKLGPNGSFLNNTQRVIDYYVEDFFETKFNNDLLRLKECMPIFGFNRNGKQLFDASRGAELINLSLTANNRIIANIHDSGLVKELTEIGYFPDIAQPEENISTPWYHKRTASEPASGTAGDDSASEGPFYGVEPIPELQTVISDEPQPPIPAPPVIGGEDTDDLDDTEDDDDNNW